MIRVTDLTVRVPGFALERVSFTVPEGGVGVVTGPTGAGKTTLLEAIAGVREPVGGTVVLGDVDVTRRAPEHRNLGLVYQQALLFPHLTVQANVAYGAPRATLVASLVDMLALAPLFERPVPMLSGGERQLVALARALARAPRTLLLDEPFAAMDAALRARVSADVLRWASERRITTLLVTHDAAEATRDGSVTLRMAAGLLTTG